LLKCFDWATNLSASIIIRLSGDVTRVSVDFKLISSLEMQSTITVAIIKHADMSVKINTSDTKTRA